jgi:hypothetical protein
MMMRILRFAGFDILVSDRHLNPVNPVDPHGVLELDNIKEIQDHPPSWTANKAIKIVTPYIALLPLDRPVKVIFMQRDITEIVASLMVQRTLWEDDPWTSIQRARRYLEGMNIPTHYVRYAEIMKYPKSTIRGIMEFLEVEFDISEAAKGVDENPREIATFEKKLVRVDKDNFYKDANDIMVLNDPNYEVTLEGKNV